MLRMFLLVFAGLTLAAQTQIDLRTQAKRVDFTAADSTRPMKTGTALPATCALGDMFFKTDAQAGVNLYGCTAANTWSVQGGIPSGNCQYDAATHTLRCADTNGNVYTTVETAASGTANQWVDYIAPTGIPHTSQPTAAAVGAVADPGSNGVPYRNGPGTAAPAGADQLSGPFFCQDAGAGGGYACNLNPPISGYGTGTSYWFKAGAANTGAATINFNALGPKPIVKQYNQALAANDIHAGQWVIVTYDGTNMQMQSQTANAPQGAVSSVFGRSGPVVAQSGDYTTAQVTESGNLYFTSARARGALSGSGPISFNASTGAVDCPGCVTSSTAADTDLYGSFPHLSVVRLQGLPVSGAPPANLQYLGWNSGANQWEPKALPAAPVTSAFGRTGAVAAQSGDYSFSQISGTAGASQLPAVAMLTNQSNAVTAGTQDFSNAAHTLPMKSGTTAMLPPLCATGETYFATDAPAGGNVYGCAAANVWSAQGKLSVKSAGFTVGTRGAANFITGAGLMSTISDDGSEINIQSALDSAVVQTQPGAQSGAALLCASSSGSASQYACSLNPTLAAYTSGMVLHWKPDVAGAGGATTLNVDTLGAKSLKATDGVSDPASTDISAGKLYNIWYDGGVFRFVTGTGGTSGGGAVASVFGRTGSVVAQSGDYTTAQVTESGNLYFTNARAQSALSGMYQTPITGAPGTWPSTWAWASLSGAPSFATVATSGSYADLSNKPALGALAAVGYPSAGIVKSSGSAFAAAVSGTDYAPATSGTSVLKGNGSGGFSAAAASDIPGLYPGAGVPNSTGSAWGSSYTVGTGANNLVQLNASGQLPAVSAALLTNFPATLMTTSTGVTAGQMPALTGDATSAAGGVATTVAKVNGASVPASAALLGTNSSSQLVAQTMWGTGTKPVAASALGTSGDCVQWSSAGIGDAGAPCGTGSGSGGANALGYYFVSQAANQPANAVNLGALNTGLLKISVSGGVATPSNAAAGTDYVTPGGSITGTAANVTGTVAVANGGTGAAGALSGLVRGSSSAMTAAELSGDATTSGSNVVTVAKVNGTSVPANSSADQVLGTIAGATGSWISVANCPAGLLQYSTSSHAFSCGTPLSNPMTAAGDLLYGGASGSFTRLAGDTSNIRKFLRTQSAGGTAAAPAWDTLTAADIPAALSATTSVNGTPIPPSSTLMATNTSVQASQLPASAAGALGGVNSKDCSGVGAVQKINTDGSIACGSVGGSTRTWPFSFRGIVQSGVAGFTANLPSSNAPTPTNVGGTDPTPVLEWPTAQSVDYAWWLFDLPAGYVSNSNIGYSIASRSTDSTHAAILTPYWACVSAGAVDAPAWNAGSTVNITGAASSGRVVTTGNIAPTCAAGNMAGIKFKIDTSANSMTGPFDLVSVTFSVQGGM